MKADDGAGSRRMQVPGGNAGYTLEPTPAGLDTMSSSSFGIKKVLSVGVSVKWAAWSVPMRSACPVPPAHEVCVPRAPCP